MEKNLIDMEGKYVRNRWLLEDKIEKRDYQEAIAENAIKANTLCVLPTAMGKTIISLLLVTKMLDRDMDRKIMFLAPTRPLVEQHKNTFEKFLKLGLNLVPITGKIKPEEREKQYKFGDIIFATPQSVRNDLRKRVLNLSNFSLLIVDEAQHSVGNYAYTYVAGKFMEQTKLAGKQGLIVGLTASPSGRYSKINEIKKNLYIENVEIRSEKDEDVKDYVKDVKTTWVEVQMSTEMENLRQTLEEMKSERISALMKWHIIYSPNISRTQILELQKKLVKTKSGFSFAALSVLSEVIKLDYAIELLETQSAFSLIEYLDKILENARAKKSKADARLSRDERFYSIIEQARKIGSHPKMEKLVEIVEKELKNSETRIMIFAQFRNTVKRIKETLEKIPECKPVVLVGQSGKDGLKQNEQIELISMYDSGFYNTLITTSIGEEGLHLGSATTAIFYEAVPSEIRSIQRRGRIGRERAGKLYILMTKKTRDESYFWSSHHKEKKMKKILENMKSQTDLSRFDKNSETKA